MQVDGSQRTRLDRFGRPRWSPDGGRFLMVDFAIPAHVSLLDQKTNQRSAVRIPDMEFWSAPNWASDRTIVAVVGAGWGDKIAIVDVTNPERAKVKEVLWEMNFKGQGVDVNPHGPVYHAGTGRCVFVGGAREGMVLYSFTRGQASQPKRLEPEGYDSLLQDLAFSPDGRYVLFTSNRSGPRGADPNLRRSPRQPRRTPARTRKRRVETDLARETPAALIGQPARFFPQERQRHVERAVTVAVVKKHAARVFTSTVARRVMRLTRPTCCLPSISKLT